MSKPVSSLELSGFEGTLKDLNGGYKISVSAEKSCNRVWTRGRAIKIYYESGCWWIGPEAGGTQVWARAPSPVSDSEFPPQSGWYVPWDCATANPSIRCRVGKKKKVQSSDKKGGDATTKVSSKSGKLPQAPEAGPGGDVKKGKADESASEIKKSPEESQCQEPSKSSKKKSIPKFNFASDEDDEEDVVKYEKGSVTLRKPPKEQPQESHVVESDSSLIAAVAAQLQHTAISNGVYSAQAYLEYSLSNTGACNTGAAYGTTVGGPVHQESIMSEDRTVHQCNFSSVNSNSNRRRDYSRRGRNVRRRGRAAMANGYGYGYSHHTGHENISDNNGVGMAWGLGPQTEGHGGGGINHDAEWHQFVRELEKQQTVQKSENRERTYEDTHHWITSHLENLDGRVRNYITTLKESETLFSDCDSIAKDNTFEQLFPEIEGRREARLNALKKSNNMSAEGPGFGESCPTPGFKSISEARTTLSTLLSDAKTVRGGVEEAMKQYGFTSSPESTKTNLSSGEAMWQGYLKMLKAMSNSLEAFRDAINKQEHNNLIRNRAQSGGNHQSQFGGANGGSLSQTQTTCNALAIPQSQHFHGGEASHSSQIENSHGHLPSGHWEIALYQGGQSMEPTCEVPKFGGSNNFAGDHQSHRARTGREHSRSFYQWRHNNSTNSFSHQKHYNNAQSSMSMNGPVPPAPPPEDDYLQLGSLCENVCNVVTELDEMKNNWEEVVHNLGTSSSSSSKSNKSCTKLRTSSVAERELRLAEEEGLFEAQVYLSKALLLSYKSPAAACNAKMSLSYLKSLASDAGRFDMEEKIGNLVAEIGLLSQNMLHPDELQLLFRYQTVGGCAGEDNHSSATVFNIDNIGKCAASGKTDSSVIMVGIGPSESSENNFNLAGDLNQSSTISVLSEAEEYASSPRVFNITLKQCRRINTVYRTKRDMVLTYHLSTDPSMHTEFSSLPKGTLLRALGGEIWLGETEKTPAATRVRVHTLNLKGSCQKTGYVTASDYGGTVKDFLVQLSDQERTRALKKVRAERNSNANKFNDGDGPLSLSDPERQATAKSQFAEKYSRFKQEIDAHLKDPKIVGGPSHCASLLLNGATANFGHHQPGEASLSWRQLLNKVVDSHQGKNSGSTKATKTKKHVLEAGESVRVLLSDGARSAWKDGIYRRPCSGERDFAIIMWSSSLFEDRVPLDNLVNAAGLQCEVPFDSEFQSGETFKKPESEKQIISEAEEALRGSSGGGSNCGLNINGSPIPTTPLEEFVNEVVLEFSYALWEVCKEWQGAFTTFQVQFLISSPKPLPEAIRSMSPAYVKNSRELLRPLKLASSARLVASDRAAPVSAVPSTVSCQTAVVRNSNSYNSSASSRSNMPAAWELHQAVALAISDGNEFPSVKRRALSLLIVDKGGKRERLHAFAQTLQEGITALAGAIKKIYSCYTLWERFAALACLLEQKTSGSGSGAGTKTSLSDSPITTEIANRGRDLVSRLGTMQKSMASVRVQYKKLNTFVEALAKYEDFEDEQCFGGVRPTYIAIPDPVLCWLVSRVKALSNFWVGENLKSNFSDLQAHQAQWEYLHNFLGLLSTNLDLCDHHREHLSHDTIGRGAFFMGVLQTLRRELEKARWRPSSSTRGLYTARDDRKNIAMCYGIVVSAFQCEHTGTFFKVGEVVEFDGGESGDYLAVQTVPDSNLALPEGTKGGFLQLVTHVQQLQHRTNTKRKIFSRTKVSMLASRYCKAERGDKLSEKKNSNFPLKRRKIEPATETTPTVPEFLGIEDNILPIRDFVSLVFPGRCTKDSTEECFEGPRILPAGTCVKVRNWARTYTKGEDETTTTSGSLVNNIANDAASLTEIKLEVEGLDGFIGWITLFKCGELYAM